MVKLFLKNSNLCDHNSPTSQTDRQTTCDRNTALCTKVHRTVMIARIRNHSMTSNLHHGHNTLYFMMAHNHSVSSLTLQCPLLPYGLSHIKHPVQHRVKPSFVIFDNRALWRSGLSVRVSGCQKLQMPA